MLVPFARGPENTRMSLHIGDRIPPPLRFEFGTEPSDDIGHAVLAVTVDDDGLPRVAVLSPAELKAPDDRSLVIDLNAAGTSWKNMKERRCVAVWCVLDAAAYTIKGDVEPIGGSSFLMKVKSVWRDFDPAAPMVAGPAFKRKPGPP